jgi:hypothetical protein
MVVAGLFLVGSAVAQVAIPQGYDVGTHIVRTGDTLIEVTEAYLGTDELWETNWELNPHIQDPDLLFPLQRLTVLIAPAVSRPIARLTTISGSVEGKPVPSDWLLSEQDDMMIERDGVRAGKNESAVMRFLDGTELTVRDDSTVFLRAAGRSLRGFEQRSVELVRGEADLVAQDLPVESDIEVVIGQAVATSRAEDEGSLETRARRVESGGARVMMFEGISEVVAGGETVTLGSGTGTAIPEAGPPAPPETLLAQATELVPEAGGSVEVGRGVLAWTPVEGAESYTVEICRDLACGNLVARRTNLIEPSSSTEGLPVGEYFWRVTAVSGSGLDGFPSPSQAVRTVRFREDSQPPTGELVVTGSSAESNGVLHYGADLAVRLDVSDDVTGVESTTLMLDGRQVTPEELSGPWTSGEYEVSAVAVDVAGNEASFGPLVFRVDADPPMIGVRVAGGELFPEAEREIWERQSRRWSKDELSGVTRLGWVPRIKVVDRSDTGGESVGGFVPDLRTESEGSGDRLTLLRSEVAVLVFAPALMLDRSLEPLADRILLLEAEDERSGLVRFDLRRRPGPDGWHWLELEAADAVGNVTSRRWQFARPN